MKKAFILVLVLSLFLPINVHALEYVENNTINNKIKSENNRKLEYLNVKKWHSLGYTGKGVKILLSDNGKVWDEFPNFDGKVKIVRENSNSDVPVNTHAMAMAQILHQIAPDAEIFVGEFPYVKDALDNDYQLVAASVSTGMQNYNTYRPQYSKAYNANIFMNNAIGNYDINSYNVYADSPYWWSTGAVDFEYNGNDIRREYYSSLSANLKSVSFTNFRYHYFQDSGTPFAMNFGGSSGASPVLTGMLALYYQYHHDMYGKYPTIKQSQDFILNNSEDLGEPGRDKEYGNGLFVLPETNFGVGTNGAPTIVMYDGSGNKKWVWASEYDTLLKQGHKLHDSLTDRFVKQLNKRTEGINSKGQVTKKYTIGSGTVVWLTESDYKRLYVN